MPFKISLVSDVRQWLKGTADVEKSLTDVAESLDDLATSSGQSATEASDNLERKFSSAFEKVKSEAKTTGDSVGDNVKRGTERASEGTDALKENAKQNAKEIGASFDGSAQSIANGFQGLAAEAFEGFGPAGVAAGVAVAAGMGLASAALSNADEQAKEAKEATLELGKSLATATTRAQGLASAVADAMSEATKNPQNVIEGLFGGGDTDRLTLYSDIIRNAGLEYGDVLKAMSGDDEAYQRVVTQAWAKTDQAHEQSTISFMDDLNKRNAAFKDAETWADEYANSQVAAQQKAADAAAIFSDSLTDNLSIADEGLDEFVRGSDVKLKDWNKKLKDSTKTGVLDVDAWADAVKRRARENKLILSFTADVDTKLSPEALENFEQLPTDTQAAIARAYKKKGNQKKIVSTLEAEAKVSKVDIDTSKAKTDPIKVDTTVIATGVPKDVRDAADAGQREANKSSNAIEIKTKIDRGDLQRAVNRAAASITPPTIYVNIKARKEVP